MPWKGPLQYLLIEITELVKPGYAAIFKVIVHDLFNNHFTFVLKQPGKRLCFNIHRLDNDPVEIKDNRLNHQNLLSPYMARCLSFPLLKVTLPCVFRSKVLIEGGGKFLQSKLIPPIFAHTMVIP